MERGGAMPTYAGQVSRTAVRFPVDRRPPVVRDLDAAYARERIEEVIRAVAEDALSPGLDGAPPWHDELDFTDELLTAIQEVTETADRLLAERLTELLATASPGLVGRLATAPRLSDLS
jgi:hypothetical protein